MSLRNSLLALQEALSFLTVFPPARSSVPFANALPYFFPAGMLLGSFLLGSTKCLGLFFEHNLPKPYLPFLLAWFYLALEIGLTRALHWDGLCDFFDAAGSNAQGDRFWEILHDSRLGAFGAISLVLLFLGQFIAIAAHLALSHSLILLLAPAWARQTPFWLLARCHVHPVSKIGTFFSEETKKSASARFLSSVFLYAVPVLLSFFTSDWRILLLIPFQYLVLSFICHTAKKQGGLSGDFFGCAIELSMLTFLLTTL